MHSENYDVIVVGGGTSGVIAAIAAGREGARTLLIERYGCKNRTDTGEPAHTSLAAAAAFRRTGILQDIQGKSAERRGIYRKGKYTVHHEGSPWSNKHEFDTCPF